MLLDLQSIITGYGYRDGLSVLDSWLKWRTMTQ
jgi:hypothetical protein